MTLGAVAGSRRRTAAAASPAFDAVGAGRVGTTTAQNPSWSHTAASGAYGIVYFALGTVTATVSSVTWGGSAMTLLGSRQLNDNNSSGTLFMYGLANVPSGSQTVQVNLSAARDIAANSVSYTGVTSVGTPATAIGASAPSHAMTCSAGQTITHAFGDINYDFTSPTGGNTRYNGFPASDFHMNLLIQDSSSSVTFAATLQGGDAWSAIGAVLS